MPLSATVAESESAFFQRVRTQEAELGSTTNELGKKNLELAKELNYCEVRGKLLVPGRWATSWEENGARKRWRQAGGVELVPSRAERPVEAD